MVFCSEFFTSWRLFLLGLLAEYPCLLFLYLWNHHLPGEPVSYWNLWYQVLPTPGNVDKSLRCVIFLIYKVSHDPLLINAQRLWAPFNIFRCVLHMIEVCWYKQDSRLPYHLLHSPPYYFVVQWFTDNKPIIAQGTGDSVIEMISFEIKLTWDQILDLPLGWYNSVNPLGVLICKTSHITERQI